MRLLPVTAKERLGRSSYPLLRTRAVDFGRPTIARRPIYRVPSSNDYRSDQSCSLTVSPILSAQPKNTHERSLPDPFVRLSARPECRGSGFSSLMQLVEQRLSLLQVQRVEALGEPRPNRRQKSAGLAVPPLVAPEPGEAGGGTQFE
jgi:hypothetical protein